MKATTARLAVRQAAQGVAPPLGVRWRFPTRCFASQHGLGTTDARKPKRRGVTPFNDDGHVPWSELSAVEKTARATQQSFNFGMIIVGLVLTVSKARHERRVGFGTVGSKLFPPQSGVAYFMWTDVFSPDSKISQFNRAIDKIKKDPRCVELLGDSKKIIAHGEETLNKWRRARPVASSEKTDSQGNQHLVMHFHVDGPLRNGIAQLHMIRRRGDGDYEYKYLFVDVKGHDRIYLENADDKPSSGKKQFSFLGVKWG
ncbi:import inner membrane translocase subunit tim-21 [Drechmeria coniospora]|uniref:Mitochondrial import inner membrane translocase subunit Tim21 n=1 Tax=Drechmeria coniospora TaxID=98403 RepID=A0A151GQG2_DRECN|nr:import inner membrane translocase subunit tim-21 [Drechmeria coniospora]KYK59355.1 import inner membrane translocase subunit tim-21 [Drechmeria coniospora]